MELTAHNGLLLHKGVGKWRLWGLIARVCVSNKCPGDATAAAPNVPESPSPFQKWQVQEYSLQHCLSWCKLKAT